MKIILRQVEKKNEKDTIKCLEMNDIILRNYTYNMVITE
jgi:hypothetical protein